MFIFLFLFFLVHVVCVGVHVCVWMSVSCVHVQMPEVEISCLPLLLTTLISSETVFF